MHLNQCASLSAPRSVCFAQRTSLSAFRSEQLAKCASLSELLKNNALKVRERTTTSLSIRIVFFGLLVKYVVAGQLHLQKSPYGYFKKIEDVNQTSHVNLFS